MKVLQIGDPAPEFTLPDHQGNLLTLSDFLGKCAVVLFFYPADESPVCTREACAFRDSYEDFRTEGAVVIGVSSDSAESHHRFASHHHLPFPLLSDVGGNLRKAYGVSKTLGVLPGRVTFVIDKSGIIRMLFNSQLAAERHVQQALTLLRERP